MKMGDKKHPAKWPLNLLKRVKPISNIEEIEEDILETYERRYYKMGASQASRLYYRDVLSLLFYPLQKRQNPYTINHGTMLQNYFKLTLRNIQRNRLTSSISIIGLAVAASCCIVLFLFGLNIVTANSHISNADRIYMISSEAFTPQNDRFTWGQTPALLAPALREENGELIVSRYTYDQAIAKRGDRTIEENIQYVDRSFLQMFDFKLSSGNQAALSDPGTIVISHEIAEKYFPEIDPLGKELLLTINGNTESFVVGAVAEEFPDNSYFDFDILLDYQHAEDIQSWSTLTNATFVMFNNTDKGIELSNYTELYNAIDNRYRIEKFELIQFDKLSELSSIIVQSVVGGEHPSTLALTIAFGLLLLFIACFNYINIALVSASRRLKEIGLRKTIGASKKQLVFQFLSQNIFLCLIAVFVGIVFAQFLLLPLFNSFFPFELAIDYSDIRFLMFLFFIALLTGIISGLYPALYISSFDATYILKGKEKFGGNKNYLFRVFLGLQFFITFLILFSGVAFYGNSKFQKDISWGYNKLNIVAVPLTDSTQYQFLENTLSQYPEISLMSGGKHHIGDKASSVNLRFDNDEIRVRHYQVNANYLDFMGMNLLEGSTFPEDIRSNTNKIIVNRSFANQYFVDEVPGTFVKTSDGELEVIGIVEDFHYSDFYSPIQPVIFSVSEKTDNNFLLAKSANPTEAEKLIKAQWVDQFPDAPYSGYFQEDIFDDYFRQMSIPTNMLLTFAAISIILSCMGLYGLISLMFSKRLKEIGIRKILGASILHIAKITNAPYLIILSIALVLAIPLSQSLIKSYLDQVNAYHIPVGLNIILPSILLLIFTIVITLGINLMRFTKSDPVEVLRQDA